MQAIVKKIVIVNCKAADISKVESGGVNMVRISISYGDILSSFCSNFMADNFLIMRN